LISDVSDASRLDAELSRVTAQPLDVVPILRTLQEMDEATRDEDNDPKLEVVAPPGGMKVWAVEDRLVQVLRNLIGNAHSFSPPRGRIVVRVREAGGVAELCVEDDGPGIPDANLEHIFDRFYSERPSGESFGQHSGLGLSISRQIVEALQGQLSAENRRDGNGHVLGARFLVRLPIA
jgi:two-component system sensor histidine kinase ChvG